MRKICARSISLARPVLAIFCLLIILVGCERKDKDHSPQDKIQVATTINIIGDWVKVVGGDKVNVDSLVPTNGDPHTFEPGAREVTKLADAKAIFAIGLGLEAGWLNKLIENASKDSYSIVHLAEFVDPIPWEGHGEEAGHSEHKDEGEHKHKEEHDKETGHSEHKDEGEHKHGKTDPHFWMDPMRVQKAVLKISDVLTLLDPENSAYYSNNANSYNSTLQSMNKWATAALSEVPESKRYLVTGHENLGYFAKRYQFEVIGSLVPALSTEREPTPKEMVELVKTIKDNQLTAIFTEISENSKLGQTISKETGAAITQINSASLGSEGSETGSYVKFFETIVNTIVKVLV